ncbi:metallophosphoesterase [Methanohalobium sp.]|uniref:metallophosphoesterase family protein n=1 Tax=Methanohalobium sp. TaxID=2837493 RepID=UPI002600A775|nr:metallophosphoesterase family protein [Methanohalobium sp.]
MKLLIISDIHANKEAFNTVLSIPHDEIICLGDLVDYGPSPHECIELTRQNNIETVKGNHDNAVASGIDCGCGYDYKHLSIATREYTWSQLDKKDINFLKKLPDKTVKNIDGLKLYFSHGSPRSMYEYIKPETPKKQIREMIMDLNADFIFVGHSHIPLIENIDKKTIINPGAVGQPRDGNSRASCALFNTISQKVEVIRCEYDVNYR